MKYKIAALPSTPTPTPTPKAPVIGPIAPTPVPTPDFADAAATAVAIWNTETYTTGVKFCEEGSSGCSDSHRVSIHVVTPIPAPSGSGPVASPTPTFPCRNNALACITLKGAYPHLQDLPMYFPQPLHFYMYDNAQRGYVLKEYIWTDNLRRAVNDDDYLYLPSVMLHEFGHTAGPGHTWSGNEVMSGEYNTQMTVQPNDTEALKANYEGHSRH